MLMSHPVSALFSNSTSASLCEGRSHEVQILEGELNIILNVLVLTVQGSSIMTHQSLFYYTIAHAVKIWPTLCQPR